MYTIYAKPSKCSPRVRSRTMFPRSSLVRLPWFEKQKIHMVLRDSFQVMFLLRGPNPQRKFLSFRATPKSTFPPCHPSTMSFHPGVRLQIRAHHETSSWLGFQPKVPGAARWPAYTYRSGKDVITPKNGSRKLELLVFLQSKNKYSSVFVYIYASRFVSLLYFCVHVCLCVCMCVCVCACVWGECVVCSSIVLVWECG